MSLWQIPPSWHRDEDRADLGVFLAAANLTRVSLACQGRPPIKHVHVTPAADREPELKPRPRWPESESCHAKYIRADDQAQVSAAIHPEQGGL
jgi:hypothetical protein